MYRLRFTPVDLCGHSSTLGSNLSWSLTSLLCSVPWSTPGNLADVLHRALHNKELRNAASIQCLIGKDIYKLTSLYKSYQILCEKMRSGGLLYVQYVPYNNCMVHIWLIFLYLSFAYEVSASGTRTFQTAGIASDSRYFVVSVLTQAPSGV